MTNWLVSYPRSGSTWCRYCLEFLSKHPSRGYPQGKGSIDSPIYNFVNIGVNVNKPDIVLKRHQWHGFNKGDKGVLLVRDYKECLVRHFKTMDSNKIKQVNLWEEQLNWYFELLEVYDGGADDGTIGAALRVPGYPTSHEEWPERAKIFKSAPRLLIYYEDLLNNTQHELSKLLDFLEVDAKLLPEFIKNINAHKQASLKIYNRNFIAMSQGIDMKFHSKNFNKEKLEFMKQYLIKKSKSIYDKYLSRYD